MRTKKKSVTFISKKKKSRDVHILWIDKYMYANCNEYRKPKPNKSKGKGGGKIQNTDVEVNGKNDIIKTCGSGPDQSIALSRIWWYIRKLSVSRSKP